MKPRPEKVPEAARRPALHGALLLACLVLAMPGPAAAGEPRPADPGSPCSLDPALAKSIAALQRGLENLRGLDFASDVKSAAMSREEARAYLREILHREYSPPELAAEEEAYRYFDLIDGERGLEEIYLEMVVTQVAGLYDPRRKTLFVVQGPLSGTMPLAHELAHALIDQHFDLDALQNEAGEDDDRALAFSALIEGDATMVTTLWMIRSAMDPDLPELTMGTEDLGELLEAAGAGLEGAPTFVTRTLLFPYSEGVAWAAEVMKKGGGLQALDPFFRRPPDSTEQILHPGKSLEPRDRPSRIRADLLRTGLPATARRIKEDSMGEFAIRLLLETSSPDGAVRAAEGWDGDRYLLSRGGGGSFLTWVSIWDTDEDAEEFREAIDTWLARRARPRDRDPERAAAARREGRIVIVVEGDGGGDVEPPADRAAALAARLPAGVEIR